MRKLLLFAAAMASGVFTLAVTPTAVRATPMYYKDGWSPGCPEEGVPDRRTDEVPFFEDHSSLLYAPCNHDNLSYLMRQSFQFITELPDNFDGSMPYADTVLDFSPLAYVHDNLKFIRILPDVPPDCRDAAAFVGGELQQTMQVCANMKGASLITRAALIIHETRHAQGNLIEDKHGYPHVDCKVAPFNVSPENGGCDIRLEDTGAYATQIEFYLGVARLAAISDAVRTEARANAVRDMIQHFNERPEFKVGAALLREDNNLVFYDGANMEPLILGLPDGFKIGHDTDVIRIFDPTKKSDAIYGFNHKLPFTEDHKSITYWPFDSAFITGIAVHLREDGHILNNPLKSSELAIPGNYEPYGPVDTLMVIDDKWVDPSMASRNRIYIRHQNGKSTQINLTWAAYKEDGRTITSDPLVGHLIERYRAIVEVPKLSRYSGRLMGLNAENGQLEILPPNPFAANNHGKVIVEPSSIQSGVKQMTAPILYAPVIEDL